MLLVHAGQGRGCKDNYTSLARRGGMLPLSNGEDQEEEFRKWSRRVPSLMPPQVSFPTSLSLNPTASITNSRRPSVLVTGRPVVILDDSLLSRVLGSGVGHHTWDLQMQRPAWELATSKVNHQPRITEIDHTVMKYGKEGHSVPILDTSLTSGSDMPVVLYNNNNSGDLTSQYRLQPRFEDYINNGPQIQYPVFKDELEKEYPEPLELPAIDLPESAKSECKGGITSMASVLSSFTLDPLEFPATDPLESTKSEDTTSVAPTIPVPRSFTLEPLDLPASELSKPECKQESISRVLVPSGLTLEPYEFPAADPPESAKSEDTTSVAPTIPVPRSFTLEQLDLPASELSKPECKQESISRVLVPSGLTLEPHEFPAADPPEGTKSDSEDTTSVAPTTPKSFTLNPLELPAADLPESTKSECRGDSTSLALVPSSLPPDETSVIPESPPTGTWALSHQSPANSNTSLSAKSQTDIVPESIKLYEESPSTETDSSPKEIHAPQLVPDETELAELEKDGAQPMVEDPIKRDPLTNESFSSECASQHNFGEKILKVWTHSIVAVSVFNTEQPKINNSCATETEVPEVDNQEPAKLKEDSSNGEKRFLPLPLRPSRAVFACEEREEQLLQESDSELEMPEIEEASNSTTTSEVTEALISAPPPPPIFLLKPKTNAIPLTTESSSIFQPPSISLTDSSLFSPNFKLLGPQKVTQSLRESLAAKSEPESKNMAQASSQLQQPPYKKQRLSTDLPEKSTTATEHSEAEVPSSDVMEPQPSNEPPATMELHCTPNSEPDISQHFNTSRDSTDVSNSVPDSSQHFNTSRDSTDIPNSVPDISENISTSRDSTEVPNSEPDISQHFSTSWDNTDISNSASEGTCKHLKAPVEEEATVPDLQPVAGIMEHPRQPYENADDGLDTSYQAVPTESAREHALVQNVVSCEESSGGFGDHDDSNDGSRDAVEVDPATNPSQDENKYQTVPLADSEVPCLEQQDQDLMQQDSPSPEVPNFSIGTPLQTFVPGMETTPTQQIVPGGSVNTSFATPSFYEEESKAKKVKFAHNPNLEDVDIDKLDGPTVLAMALESIEARRKTLVSPECVEVPDKSPVKSQWSSFYATGSNFGSHCGAAAPPQGLELVQTTRLNLSKPKLRLGLSKRQRCKPLHHLN